MSSFLFSGRESKPPAAPNQSPVKPSQQDGDHKDNANIPPSIPPSPKQ